MNNAVKGGYKPTKLQALLEDFLAEEIPVAEILMARDRNPLNVYRSLRVAINRLNYQLTLRVKSKDEHVYLINQPLLEKYKEEYCEKTDLHQTC